MSQAQYYIICGFDKTYLIAVWKYAKHGKQWNYWGTLFQNLTIYTLSSFCSWKSFLKMKKKTQGYVRIFYNTSLTCGVGSDSDPNVITNPKK